MRDERKELLDRVKEIVTKLEADYEAGLVSEEEYQEKCRLVEEAADKIEELSNSKERNKVIFWEALDAIGNHQKVSCSMGDHSTPVVYKVVNGELTVNGKVKDFRDFCFSPSQILFGKWTIEERE